MSRVLLIDDDEDLSEALASWLGLRGHEVRTLHDGQHAATVARAFAPDLVLLDAQLGRTSGATVAGQLAAAGVRHVVFCTALAPEELPAGMPVLEKPLHLERLEALLDDGDQPRTDSRIQARYGSWPASIPSPRISGTS